MKLNSMLKQYGIYLLIGLISLFLGYLTYRWFNPIQPPEIVVEMEALPAPSPLNHSTLTSIDQAIYESRCAACHDSGAAGSPRVGDKAAWKLRLQKGKTILFKHVIDGYNLMPPRGACLECSDEDLNLAFEYILNKSK